MEDIEIIKSELSESLKILENLDVTLASLKQQKSGGMNKSNLEEENESLKVNHQINTQDIEYYKSEILKLEEKRNNNQAKILKLKEENQKLKNNFSKSKNIINKNSNFCIN